MIKSKGFAAHTAKAPLAPFEFERREVGSTDVQFDILFCGVCHSDLHQVRDEWGGGKFPMVPGHEIVGKVTKIGDKVTKFKVGDLAGVGCMVNSCRDCKNCQRGLEQFCTNGSTSTYNSYYNYKFQYMNCHMLVRNHHHFLLYYYELQYRYYHYHT